MAAGALLGKRAARRKEEKRLARIPDPLTTLYSEVESPRSIREEVCAWMDIYKDDLKEQGYQWREAPYRKDHYQLIGKLGAVDVTFDHKSFVSLHRWDKRGTAILGQKLLRYKGYYGGSKGDLEDLSPEEAALVVINEALLLSK